MCPIAPDALWTMDFQFDNTPRGRTLELLNIIDEYTHECPAVLDRPIEADRPWPPPPPRPPAGATPRSCALAMGALHRRRGRLVSVQRCRPGVRGSRLSLGGTPGSSGSTGFETNLWTTYRGTVNPRRVGRQHDVGQMVAPS